MTTEAVIISTARTGVGKAYRGALNNTDGPTMAGHVIAEAVKRAGIAPGEVEDVVMGCAMQQGTMVMNVARKGAIRAGLPVTVAGTTIDRQCASGLQAIAVAARSVMLDGVEIAIGGGIESISLVQNEHMNKFHAVDDELMTMKPEMYMSMLETAEVVAERYKIGRDKQDEYSLECQRRVGAALQGGRFTDEIVPITTKMAVVNKDTKEVSYQQVAGEPRASHAIGMADRDRAAIDVQLVGVDAELVAAIDHLDRISLVELPEIDVVDLQIVPLQKPRNRGDRADAHFVRLDAGGDEATEDAKRLQALLCRDLVAHDHASRRAVGELAGISSADSLALEHRLDLC